MRVNFKTLTLAEQARVAIAPLTAETRDRAIQALNALVVEPVCALAIDGFPSATRGNAGAARLFIRFEGTATSVERATRDLRSALGAAGVASTTILDEGADGALDELLAATIESLGERSITYRASGLPDAASRRAAYAMGLGRDAGLTIETIADLRTGDVFIRASAVAADAVLAALPVFDPAVREALGPSMIVAGGSAVRRAVDVWGTLPPSFPVMREIKMRFDPQATLAPGRYVGGL